MSNSGALYLATIKKMRQVSNQKGQIFIVGFLQADPDFFKGTSYTNEKIFTEIKKNVDQIIDLSLSDKSGLLAKQYYIHALDRHPSALANKISADSISRLISARVK